MNEIDRFRRDFEEITDLYRRGTVAFNGPRRDMAALKARHDRDARNVVVYCDENRNPERYVLEFTPEQADELRGAYHIARGGSCPGDEDHIFVKILEGWADAILDLQSLKPPDQKARTRAIESFVVGCHKIDTALSDLDSTALGWLYGNVVDELATKGIQISDGDGRIASMKAHAMRAQVEGAELRHVLREVVAAVVKAAATASNTLPKHDHEGSNPRWKIAQALERLVIEHDIAFDTAEAGFPAKCLRSMFDLAGLDVEKVSHWLKKAAADPDSYRRFLQRMAEKLGGEIPPPV